MISHAAGSGAITIEYVRASRLAAVLLRWGFSVKNIWTIRVGTALLSADDPLNPWPF
jgi:hypothetical protein